MRKNFDLGIAGRLSILMTLLVFFGFVTLATTLYFYNHQTIEKHISQALEESLFLLLPKLVIITIGTAIICSSLVFWLTHRLLAEPLKGLVKIAEKIEQGNYDIPEEDANHEFSILSRAFSAAAKAIQKRDKELKLQTENLEFQVEQRTKELDIERMKMVSSSRLASLGEISAGIAHEINNPLAIIQARVDMLEKHCQDNQQILQHLEKISQTVKRISNIVKGLRNFARDGTKDPMHVFGLETFVEELKGLCLARMRNHEIEFFVNCPPHLEGFGREVQISQVMINLINNSIDAIENAQSKWIRLEIYETSSHMVFAVSDSGPGVPPHLREKILEPFFTTKPVGKGTGLGLSVSVGIAHEHGGDLVYVKDSPHTRFEFRVPLTIQKAKAA